MAQGTNVPGVTPVTPAPDGTTPATGGTVSPAAQAMDLLKQILAVLAAILTGPLSATARKRLPKVRRKAWSLAPRLFELAIEKPAYAPSGKDPKELLQAYYSLAQLLNLETAMASAHKNVGDTALSQEADLWKAVLTIYGIMAAQAAHDPEVIDLYNQMTAAMANGPKAQKSVKATIHPTPVKGKAVKTAVLSAARAQAGIPEPEAPPKAPAPAVPSFAGPPAPAAPAVAAPVVVPVSTPASSVNGAGGAGSGPAHQG